MTEQLKQYGGCLGMIVILIVIGIFMWRYHASEVQKEKAIATIVKQKADTDRLHDVAANQRLTAFYTRYNAVIDWGNHISEQPYTIELQNALIRTDNRPILVQGEIGDLLKNDQSISIYLAQKLNHSPSLFFDLTCDKYIADTIINNHSDGSTYAIYDVIVKVKTVTQNQPENDESNKSTSLSTFTITGQCIAIEPSQISISPG